MGDSGGDEPVWKYVVTHPSQEFDSICYDSASAMGFAVETLVEHLMDDRDADPEPTPITVTIKKIRPSEIEETL